jgi:hypothetical protein
MQSAFNQAATRLNTAPVPDAQTTWGHSGRTIGAPVTTTHSQAWLRVLETLADRQGGKLWTGTSQAETALPPDVPRPRMINSTDWQQGSYAYRAELTTYITAPVCSSTPDLRRPIDLSGTWWSDLRQTLDTVTTWRAPTDRPPVITQDYIHRAIPRYLAAVNVDTHVHRWTLAHGDLHWANLTSPELNILDWEGFGPAPYGFDVAHLHAYTLHTPDTAAHIRALFVDILPTPEGRIAELTVAAMIVQAADRDPAHAHLALSVQNHAHRLLDTFNE